MSNLVIGVEKSQNSKTGLVSATYTPIQSCPSTCPFLNNGCYAQCGHTGIHLNRMNRVAEETKKTRPIDIARAEAKRIREMSGELPLRLHIVGDCKTAKAAEIVSRAAEEYTKKRNQPCWTYTHAWREIPRSKWGKVSVFASCETVDEAKHAMSRGYAASIVRLKPFDKSFEWKGTIMSPCLEITKGIKCKDCTRCFHDQTLLKAKQIVCFFPHGSMAYKAKGVIREKWLRQDKE